MVWLHYRELLTSDNFLALLVNIMTVVVDLSILIFFFGGKATSRSSRLMISIFCAELPSNLFRRFYFCREFINAFSPRST